MPAARLTLLLLLILVAVVLVVVLLRRGSAHRDAQRVEAAELRSEADTLAATMPGQAAFAEQAAERAEVARAEAERQAREAQRLEGEAAERRAAIEATQHDYETTMRRADDIDPDVKESSFAPVEPGSSEQEPAPAAPAGSRSTDAGHPTAGDEGESLMTRAARREAREAEEAGGGAPSAAASAGAGEAGAGAAGTAAAGAAAWGAREDDETFGESERIASAADFRDDVPEERVDPAGRGHTSAQPQTEVSSVSEPGSEPGMSVDSTNEAADHAPDGDDYAATRALHEEVADADISPETAEELSQDVESPSNEWGGPPQDEPAAADDTDLTVADVAEDPVEERFDPTPARDWAADEGEMLEEAHDRGERLKAERIELASAGDDAAVADTAGDDAAGADTATGDPASDSSNEDPASGDPASEEPA
ncbi:MAG TPA: hypothetical protein VES93_11720, partial [Ornithinibacter sp.]|nr:hypothetical protein [Ornithinibacter sp.]